MDETTTPVPAPAEGAQAQPTAAETPAVQPQPVQEQPAQQDEVMDWVSKKGYDLTTPDGVRKLAESYQNAEKLALSKAQEASELKKSLGQQAPISGDTVDPVMGEFIQDYRRDKMIGGFKETHPDWKEHEPTMAELLNQQVSTPYGTFTRSQLVNEGFLGLEEVYLMAKGTSPVDTETIKNQTRSEVLQTLANTQRAGGATPNASNPNPTAPGADPIMEAIRKSREG